jgi:hypothetical protein
MDWVCAFKEPTLDELLDDPMTVAVMRRDGVDRQRFEALVREVASRFARVCAPKSGGETACAVG